MRWSRPSFLRWLCLNLLSLSQVVATALDHLPLKLGMGIPRGLPWIFWAPNIFFPAPLSSSSPNYSWISFFSPADLLIHGAGSAWAIVVAQIKFSGIFIGRILCSLMEVVPSRPAELMLQGWETHIPQEGHLEWWYMGPFLLPSFSSQTQGFCTISWSLIQAVDMVPLSYGMLTLNWDLGWSKTILLLYQAGGS